MKFFSWFFPKPQLPIEAVDGIEDLINLFANTDPRVLKVFKLILEDRERLRKELADLKAKSLG